MNGDILTEFYTFLLERTLFEPILLNQVTITSVNGRTRYGYTSTQNSSPIDCGIKVINLVELLLNLSS